MTAEQRVVAWGDELVKLHAGFRQELARIRAGGHGADLRTHCLAFCDALHAHHEGEDAVLFPHLAAGHPELAEVLARLGAEHRVVARISGRVRDLAGADADAADELDRLSAELEAHLDYEEEQLVPLLNSMTTMPEDL
ncbi:hemerythrin HHE cation-binding protein [Nonomuraea sp. WAC 01424]|uniref:hemerythrin domain-containing protein n=1 Tax=Nonomuraea sp. WAC 01424 TaxID=2203200 RepID=UPI000F7A959C|nr:hemerythrin domain-containing protein [Nonomuraea sp. WAC 01424]RSN04378.1 hemerythrin HHE cation-binding protein [Nonomuraea sp. WAC 01424]